MHEVGGPIGWLPDLRFDIAGISKSQMGGRDLLVGRENAEHQFGIEGLCSSPGLLTAAGRM
jgi:hypothetical protein